MNTPTGSDPQSRPGALKAAVIIPAHNYPKRLDILLDALSRQTAGCRWRTVVVDDGSTADLQGVAAGYSSVLYLRQKQAGPSAARNRGAAAVNAEILVFIDQDCIPEKRWLSEMLKPFDDAKVLGTKGVFTTRQQSIVARFVQAEYEEKYHKLERKAGINFVDGYSAAFRAREFWACGGFDSGFPLPSVEDREMSMRLGKGRPCYRFCRRARVEHLHTESVTGYVRKKFKYGYWGFQIARRFPGLFVRDDHTPNTQRIQTAMIGVLPVFLFSAAIGHSWTFWGWLTGFALTAVPLSWRAMRQGPAVGLMAPVLISLRAAAIAAGLCLGFLAERKDRFPSGETAESRTRRSLLPFTMKE